MNRVTLTIAGAMLAAGSTFGQTAAFGDLIRTPEKSVPVVNQSLAGTWLYELRPGEGSLPTSPLCCS